MRSRYMREEFNYRILFDMPFCETLIVPAKFEERKGGIMSAKRMGGGRRGINRLNFFRTNEDCNPLVQEASFLFY